MKLLAFLKKPLSIARISGIPVRIEYRWFPVFVLMAWLVVSNVPRTPAGVPIVGLGAAWLLAVVTMLAFFLCILAHELSHALVARLEGIQIEEIVLHPFGGLARMKSVPDNPRAELHIAIAGPVASFIIAILAFGASHISAVSGQLASATFFFFLFFGNLLLAVFNLFPGYPLDGGRVLRALLWKRSGNITEATRISGRCGQVIAWALLAVGLYVIVSRRDFFTGAWTILVGLFLLDAASGIVRESAGLEEATVGEAMVPPVAIEPEISVIQFVDTVLPMVRQTAFPVAHSGRLFGILSLEDLKSVPRDRWHTTKAKDVMRPVNDTLFVETSTTIERANALMNQNGVGSLAVVNSAGQLVGFIQKGKPKPAR